MLYPFGGNGKDHAAITGYQCPVCRYVLQPPVRCILAGGCFFTPWDGEHCHFVCSRCNKLILLSINGEFCYAPYYRVA